MKKALFKTTSDSVIKFLDILISIDAKPLISISKEGFLETITYVWVLCTDEQITAFANNGLKPEKII